MPKKPAVVHRCVNQVFIPRWQNTGSTGKMLTDLAMPDALAPRFQPEYRPTFSVVIPVFDEAEVIARVPSPAVGRDGSAGHMGSGLRR